MNTNLGNKKYFTVTSHNYGAAYFELQPILRLIDGEIFGYEILFRGEKKIPWLEVDRLVVSYLSLNQMHSTSLFVNLSHEGLLDIPDEQFIDLTRKNRIYFELTESESEEAIHAASAIKVNRLADQGVLFAIDDYGSGRDGNLRVEELSKVEIVKIDKDLLISMMLDECIRSSTDIFLKKCVSLGIQTLAEGVETKDLLQFARSRNFNFAQGFYIDEITSVLPHALHSFKTEAIKLNAKDVWTETWELR
ncbi:MAG: EAL domain-containing protein [bacterium]|nr:EAL domain-containing protein [bacterium]